jgi:serine/threonine protein phosphatase PrpC
MQVSSALKAAGDSDAGLQRAVNEDRFHFDPIRGLFIVIDGVGGQAAGEKAAETALAMLRTRLERETGAIDDRVREAITIANNEIHRLASVQKAWQGMACVLTIAAVDGGEIVVGHVGDTRLYKLRGGRIEKLPRDHSPVGEREDAGELLERDAMQHPRRNEVYRDVGSERHEPDDPEFIDVFRVPFEPDAALLLCSDGLTDSVASASIHDIVRDYAGHPYEIVRALIDAANDAGGKDNVTVVYVENPRFAEGEDTRDLRSRRTAATEAGVPAPPASVPNSKRWRVSALIVLLFTVAGLGLYWQRDRLVVPPVLPGPTAAVTRLVVNPGESISEAIERAASGTEVVVEPGEYRERLRLKGGVRVVSRVPRGAWLRLPGGASETDAAVVAFDISGAALSGFRIIGDAATPLGIGVIVRNADVTLIDVEVTGAQRAAVQYERGAVGSLLAASLHDNPGVAIVVRAGAYPRIASSQFERNATSEHASGLLLVEADASPVLSANVFVGVRPDAVILPTTMNAASVTRDNWFIDPAARRIPPSGPGTKGRR